jgi:CxxC motif-containing protein
MRELLCIECPTGCLLQVDYDGSKLIVSGNGCKRGITFAKAEIENPMRSLTTTVRTDFYGVPVLPVRTDGEIPKGKIDEAMRELNNFVLRVPLTCGDTVLENLAGTGCRVIATSNLLK